MLNKDGMFAKTNMYEHSFYHRITPAFPEIFIYNPANFYEMNDES